MSRNGSGSASLMTRASPARSIAFVNATVLPFDDAWRVREGCDVVVENGMVTAVGRGVAKGTTGRKIDGRDLVVTPGFVNSHTHSPENLSRGVADGLPLQDWLGTVWGPLDRLDGDALRLAVLLGCIEMIRSGTVAVVDHFRQHPPRMEAVDAAARAYRQAGVAATIAVWIRDAVAVKSASERANSTEAQLEVCDEAARRWHKPLEGIRIGIGPSGPTRCSDELLRRSGRLARDRGLCFHLHVDETRHEAMEAKSRYGTTAVRHLRDLDLLWPGVSLAHGVWLSDGDMDSLAREGAGVVHNPVSNMRLGSGIARLDALHRRGVPVALGTDGAASNDGQNILEAAKAAVFLQRLAAKRDGEWPSALDALAMITRVPGRMFGQTSGTIMRGASADLVAFDRCSVAFAPGNDLHRQLVLCHTALSVRYAMAGGRLLLDDGRLTTIDEEAVLREAAKRHLTRVRRKKGSHVRKR